MKLTQDRLKELLYYNPETGLFTWRTNKGTAKKNNIAGYLNGGYYKIKIDGKFYYAHRLVFLYIDGYLPENGIDHIDMNRSNNKINNLREVSQSCNMINRNIFKNNSSGITGVYFNKNSNKWRCRIKVSKSIHIGYFDNILDAVKARWQAEVKYNFSSCNTTSSAFNYLKEKGAI